MTTREIAAHLATAASHFPLLGTVTPEALIELVTSELGHAERLEQFCPSPSGWSRAVPLTPLLHIISGNTPHAGLQTLLRGLLVGAHNRCKEPASGLAELHQFRNLLPSELAEKIEISRQLPDSWLAEAEAVIVFGSDETLTSVHRRLRPDQLFIGHGHRLSFGVLFPGSEDLPTLAQLAARDASLYDQQGCLSPHLFYIPESLFDTFAPLLAEELERFQAHTPRSPLTLEEESAIMATREEAAFRAAIDPAFRLWNSQTNSAWTLIGLPPSTPPSPFVPSCLNRTVRLIPLPDTDFTKALSASVAPVRRHLSTIGFHPCTSTNAAILSTLGASRLTKLGEMQFPSPSWHHDGAPVLLPLVRWIDYEAPSAQ